MSVLEIRAVRRAYQRGVDVLRDVSFDVAAGEVVGLLGRNGAGKTTLMRVAMGLLEAQDGRVSVFGLDPRRAPVEVKRRVGYVSEDQILPGALRVDEVIDLHRRLFPGWDAALSERLVDRFALPLRARVATLSRGQARQVALLCAVAHRPELLLLDEPAGGLDPAARREFLETSIQLLSESGTAILFSSHHMADVERMAERVVMLHDGVVLVDAPLDSLREAHCLALVPHSPAVGRRELLGLEGCLGVRDRSDALHAVFSLDPERSRALLASRFGVEGARFAQVGLEEMFIELAGGQP